MVCAEGMVTVKREEMNQEIMVSYVWTADEQIKAHENHRRAQCRPGYRAGLIFLSFMAILAGWCSYHTRGLSIHTVVFPLAGIYFLFLRKYDLRWTLRRQFGRRPDKNAPTVWKLDENALRITTAESDSKQNWSLIGKVRKAHNGFLLYPIDTLFYWLPMTAFANEDVRRQTEELLRNKVKDFAEIR